MSRPARLFALDDVISIVNNLSCILDTIHCGKISLGDTINLNLKFTGYQMITRSTVWLFYSPETMLPRRMARFILIALYEFQFFNAHFIIILRFAIKSSF
jgi:hypothetical protein